MFSESESVGASQARQRRNKAYHMVIGAAWTLGFVAIVLTAVGWGIATRTPAPVAYALPIRQVQLDRMKIVCSKTEMKHCANKVVTVCQTSINGKVVYSSDAC